MIANIWEYAKRAFGRSKTVFTNVVGLLTASWVELYDPISAFNWDDITDKHEVAIGIAMAVQILNVFFKIFMDNGEAKFKEVRDEDRPVISEHEEEEE